MQCRMDELDHRILAAADRKGWKIQACTGIQTGAVLHLLSYQVNWEQVVMWTYMCIIISSTVR